jgi:hypothetical protein
MAVISLYAMTSSSESCSSSRFVTLAVTLSHESNYILFSSSESYLSPPFVTLAVTRFYFHRQKVTSRLSS